jgi:predicted nucleotidyltransferase
MYDMQAILRTLTEALVERQRDEVDLVFQYGSYVRGTPHEYSDGDLSWVPAHPETWDSITVMVADRLYDLYAMHWSHLEAMAEFRDVSSSVLLHSRILYARDDAAAARFAALGDRLRALLTPEARPEMVRRASEILRSTGWDLTLLRLQAEAGHRAGSLRQALGIFRTVLHGLAVLNQAMIDTRKIEQVLALPKLPAGFAELAARAMATTDAAEALAVTEALLRATRELVLAEERVALRETTTYPEAFDSAYPELKRDLQGVMQASEQEDRLALKGSLLSLYHELSYAIARVTTGVALSELAVQADYEAGLTALGFPPLLDLMLEQDYAKLRGQCDAFDDRLRAFLAEHDVGLNAFADLDELRRFLDQRPIAATGQA